MRFTTIMSEENSNMTNVERAGYLVFLLRYAGSRSQRYFPFLLMGDNSGSWLKHVDDDSFNHQNLRRYHLKYVSVQGIQQGPEEMLVHCVTESEDPFIL